MTVFDVIAKRHSYRSAFTGVPVNRDDLHKILECAIMAPSGMNAQTTDFVVVDDPELVEKIRTIHTMPAVTTASTFIFCIVDRDPVPVIEGLSFDIEDCAAATENILLAITGLGYASVWLDGVLRRDGKAEQLCEWLGLPDNKIVRIMLPVGVPVKVKGQPPKADFNERVFWNVYDK